MAASAVQICNRALQKLGEGTIASLSEDTRLGRACNLLYEDVRDALLEDHTWAFAIELAEIAVSGTDPDFGRTYQYELPADFLRLLPPYGEDNTNSRDWIVEGGYIRTDDSTPLYIRYIKRETDPTKYPPSFREALSAKLAKELAQQILQSSTVEQMAEEWFQRAIRRAKAVNAIQRVPSDAVEDLWITCRD